MPTKGTFCVSFTATNGDQYEVHQPALDGLDAVWHVSGEYDRICQGGYRVACNG